jgi:hypothetical protein
MDDECLPLGKPSGRDLPVDDFFVNDLLSEVFDFVLNLGREF